MRKTAAILSALVLLVTISPTVSAQSEPSGVSVSPAITTIHAAAKQTSASFTITLTNHTSVSLNIAVGTADFSPLGEEGRISFYGKEYVAKKNPHGLSYWMHPAASEVGLNPGSSQSVRVSIDDIRSMAPGGHYGAVNFTVYPIVATRAKQGANVSSNAVLSALVFFQTAGPGNQKLALQPPGIRSLSTSLPSTVSFALSDKGNTQTVPYGYVALYRGKRLIAKSIINHQSSLVLPNSARLFNVPLDNPGAGFFGGSYSLVLAYKPSNAAGFAYYQKTVLAIGWFWPALLILILMVLVYLRLKPKPVPKPQASKPHRAIRYSSLK